MTFRGHIKNGQIVLDEPVSLPDGVRVIVMAAEQAAQITRPQRRARLRKFEPIQMPGGPLSEDIVND